MPTPTPLPRLLKTSLVEESPCLFLDLRGELDLSSVQDIPRDDFASRPDLTTVLIDLGELEFCDLTGLRALLAFCRLHEAQGRTVEVVRTSAAVRRLMQLCWVTERLHVLRRPAASAA
jgi:anti-anti-sigma factor